MVGNWKGHWPDPRNANDNTTAYLSIVGLTKDGTPCGTFRLGEPATLVPATDPDAPYGLTGTALHPLDVNFWPGLTYELFDVESAGTRLAFHNSTAQLMRSWCRLQTPIGTGSDNCVWAGSTPMFEGDACETDSVPLSSCFKMSACQYTCTCTNLGCDGNPRVGGPAFELHRANGGFEGTITTDNTPLQLYLDPIIP